MMVIGCLVETMGLGLRHWWSPTGRLVDHWQELERRMAALAPSMVNLSTRQRCAACWRATHAMPLKTAALDLSPPAELSMAKYTGALSAHQTTLLERHSRVAAGRSTAAPSTAERRITGRP